MRLRTNMKHWQSASEGCAAESCIVNGNASKYIRTGHSHSRGCGTRIKNETSGAYVDSWSWGIFLRVNACFD